MSTYDEPQAADAAEPSTAVAVANPILESIKPAVLQDKIARSILAAGDGLNVGDISAAATSLSSALFEIAKNAPENVRVTAQDPYAFIHGEKIVQVRANAIKLRAALTAYIESTVETYTTDEF